MFFKLFNLTISFTFILFLGSKKNVHTKEEHIVLIQEPGSKYLGHITPVSGKAVNILDAINNEISEEVWSKISAIGSDGTNVNTGISIFIVQRQGQGHFHGPVQWQGQVKWQVKGQVHIQRQDRFQAQFQLKREIRFKVHDHFHGPVHVKYQ